ncbi:hypothetical protein [uncultured Victivallis sp.]|uniref:hypothetical protein n=1 Tax=uncultured Victivallis sp. TaxID=354118 RepID=UPI0025D57472|nr:hypothetical protein [uncultured Victivallis sp.]
MTGKWTLPLAALAFSLTVTPFSAFAAEGDAPPPPGEQQRPEELPPPPGDRPRPGKPLPRPGRERRGPGLSEEQRMKLEELNRRIAEALAAYRAEPNDSTKAALKERITERFELQQMFAIERVEKMLARERERLENKDQEIDRQLERLLRPSWEKPQGPPRAEHMRPEERRRPDGKRPEPGRREARGPFGKVLTPEEGREAREITLALLKAEAVTPEVTAQIESLRAIYERALERQREELKAAQTAGEKESEKRVEALERSVRFLTRGVESMKQPEKFLEQLKQRAERRREPDGAKRPEEKE